MEFRQLRYFLSVANMKNYSLAAKSLFVTQPTLSWNIQKLEEELNAKLFYQINHELHLTETGEIVYDHSKKILAEIDEMTQAIQKQKHNKKSILKVGITVLFSIQYMEQIVEFSSTHPEVELTLVQNGSVELQRLLTNKEVDIGLLSFPSYQQSIEIEPLNTSHSTYSVSVVVPSDHPLASKKSIKISDLKGHSICSFSKDFVLWRILHERCIESGFNPNVVFSNNNWAVLLHKTQKDGDLSLIPAPLEKISNFSNLKWIPLKDKANCFQIGIAKRRNEKLTDAAVDFIESIRKN